MFKTGKRSTWPAFLILCLFIITAFFSGCSSDSNGSGKNDPPETSVTVFGDVHFTPFYDPDLFWELVDTPADQWAHIFSRSTVTEPQSWGKETNYPLLLKTLEAVGEASDNNPVVLFPGDILPHKFRETFFSLYGVEDEAAVRSFAYKTTAFFVEEVRKALPDIPVLFVLGNNDSYAGDYRLVPEGAYLADTADLFYNALLLSGADQEQFNKTYRAGGYYQAQPPSSKVLFICVSSVLFSALWSGEGGEEAAMKQLDWIEATLENARQKEKKVWIIMHVPPGADVYATVSKFMDESGHISHASMMWKIPYQERFLEIVRPYGDIIEACFSGHTHMDEYRVLFYGSDGSPEPVVGISAISPQFGNNPAFKVLTADQSNWELQDYRSIAYLFQEQNPVYETLYTFSNSYSLYGPLNKDLVELFPLLPNEEALKTHYIHFYYSGHDAGNPINETRWPAYWCAVGNMTKTAYMTCVNNYPETQ